MRVKNERRAITPQVLIAFISALPATLAALAAVIVSVQNGHKVTVVQEKIEKVEHATNSMKDALVADALRRGRAEGIQAEKSIAESRAEGAAQERKEAAEDKLSNDAAMRKGK